MTDLERSTLTPMEDHTTVKCKCGQVVPKAGIIYHLTKSKKHKEDPMDKGTLLKWLSVKDGWQIINSKAAENCTSFEELYNAGDDNSYIFGFQKHNTFQNGISPFSQWSIPLFTMEYPPFSDAFLEQHIHLEKHVFGM